jgi:small GTP-binding protein
MNDSFMALDSKSQKTKFKRQFTDAHIDLTIIDTNIFNELINEINIVILGGIKVGKSSFVIKVTEQRFEKPYIPTIAVEIKSKTVQYRNRTIKLNFIVTPGDKQYKEDYTPLYEKANFIFLYYDISSENSFNEAKQLLYEEVCEYAGLLKIGVTNFYFIGNKVDLTGRNTSINTIQTFCKKHKLDLFEISVKTGYGIKLLMNNMLNKYIDFMNNKS